MIHQTTFSYCLFTGQMSQHDQCDQHDLTTEHDNVTHIHDPSPMILGVVWSFTGQGGQLFDQPLYICTLSSTPHSAGVGFDSVRYYYNFFVHTFYFTMKW